MFSAFPISRQSDVALAIQFAMPGKLTPSVLTSEGLLTAALLTESPVPADDCSGRVV